MNKTIQARINESLNEIRLGNRGHLNCIKLNPQSKGPHNDKIIELCTEFLSTGTTFMTEAIFHNGRRADILLPGLQEIIEILRTESEAQFKKKIMYYPKIFTIRKVKV